MCLWVELGLHLRHVSAQSQSSSARRPTLFPLFLHSLPCLKICNNILHNRYRLLRDEPLPATLYQGPESKGLHILKAGLEMVEKQVKYLLSKHLRHIPPYMFAAIMGQVRSIFSKSWTRQWDVCGPFQSSKSISDCIFTIVTWGMSTITLSQTQSELYRVMHWRWFNLSSVDALVTYVYD